MTRTRSRYAPGRTYFFTARLRNPTSDLLVSQIDLLRDATRLAMKRRSFEVAAAVILPNQMHMIWVLPEGDADFGKRWRLVKSTFARHVPEDDIAEHGQSRPNQTGIWHRLCWEHLIRDQPDYERHIHVIATAPVEAGLVKRPGDWPYSSFSRRDAVGRPPSVKTTAPVPSSRNPSIAARAS